MMIEDELKVKFKAINTTRMSLLASLLVYSVVGWYAGKIYQEFSARLIENIKLLAYIVSALILFGSLFLRKKLLFSQIESARKGKSSNDLQDGRIASLYASFIVVASAVSEVIAIFGLILCFMGIDKETFLLFIAASAVAMILNRPKFEELKQVLEYVRKMA